MQEKQKAPTSRGFFALWCCGSDTALGAEGEAYVFGSPGPIRILADVHKGELAEHVGAEFIVGACGADHFQLAFLVHHEAYIDFAGHVGVAEQREADVLAQLLVEGAFQGCVGCFRTGNRRFGGTGVAHGKDSGQDEGGAEEGEAFHDGGCSVCSVIGRARNVGSYRIIDRS